MRQYHLKFRFLFMIVLVYLLQACDPAVSRTFLFTVPPPSSTATQIEIRQQRQEVLHLIEEIALKHKMKKTDCSPTDPSEEWCFGYFRTYEIHGRPITTSLQIVPAKENIGLRVTVFDFVSSTQSPLSREVIQELTERLQQQYGKEAIRRKE
jgi:hypothetical protein